MAKRPESEYLYDRVPVKGPESALNTRLYRVTPKRESGPRPLGLVWTRDGEAWSAVLSKTGEKREDYFSTREAAASWLMGRWSVQWGAAAKFMPTDPFEGLPGA